MTPATRTLAWLRQFAKLWGFALFCVLIVYIFREVVLPFLFAILVAYILAPLVERFGRLRVGGKPFPRAAAVIILYVNIIAVLSLFIGYFVPKLSGDFARLFRESPQLFAKVNREWLPRAGAWVDQHFGAEQGEGTEDVITGPVAPPLPHSIVLEPMSEGRYRVDLDALALEVRPGPDGRYVIAPPHSEESAAGAGGKWERSIKQWLSERLKSTEGESQRALEYGQKFIGAVVAGIGRLFLVLMVAAFILVDLVRIQDFLRSLVPEQYQVDYERIASGIDRGLAGVIRGTAGDLLHQRRLHLHRPLHLPREVSAAPGRDRGHHEPGPHLRIDPLVGAHRGHRAHLVGHLRSAAGGARARPGSSASTCSRRTCSTRRSWATLPRSIPCWSCSR